MWIEIQHCTQSENKTSRSQNVPDLTFFLPLGQRLKLTLNPSGGHQTGIPEYQELSGLVDTKL